MTKWHDSCIQYCVTHDDAQHCCHTPSVEVIGRQCHIQPSGRRAAPTLEVSSLKVWVPSPDPEDLPTRFVEVFVSSAIPAPLGSLRLTATTEEKHRKRQRRNMIF